MNNRKVITIEKLDGTKEEVEEVISFEFDDTKKRYIVYTKNETDDNGNVTVYISEVVSTSNGIKLMGVESDEEWTKIKETLRELVKDED